MNPINEQQKYAVRGLNPHRKKAIEDYSGASFLDVGCGSGAYVLYFQDKFKTHGIDHAEFPTWEQNRNLFGIGEASSLKQFADESWDSIVCFETLEHLKNPSDALKEYYRVAKKNIILTVPNCDVPQELLKSNLIFSHWNDPTHVQFFTKDSICKVVEGAGFSIDHFEFINKINFKPLMSTLLGGSGLLNKIMLNKVLSSKKEYFITSLLIARKG